MIDVAVDWAMPRFHPMQKSPFFDKRAERVQGFAAMWTGGHPVHRCVTKGFWRHGIGFVVGVSQASRACGNTKPAQDMTPVNDVSFLELGAQTVKTDL